jgi:hypothetical protein
MATKRSENNEPDDLTVVAIPSKLLSDYATARSAVVRAALPSSVWTGDATCVALRTAMHALAEHVAQKAVTP